MKHTKEVPWTDQNIETPPRLKRPKSIRKSSADTEAPFMSLRSSQDTVKLPSAQTSRWSLNSDSLTTSIKRCMSVSELEQKARNTKNKKSKVPKLPDITKSYRGSSQPSEDESDLNDRDDTVLHYTPQVQRTNTLYIENRRATIFSKNFSNSFTRLPEKKPPKINQHIGFINNLPMQLLFNSCYEYWILAAFPTL